MRKFTRRQFHLVVGAGASAALASACTTGTQGTATFGGGVAHLSFMTFPSLANPGGAVTVDVPGYFPMVVVRTDPTSAVALSATCTHAFCLMAFDGTDVRCPCHDARFGLDGSVLFGPTSIPIPTYTATVGPEGIDVQITS